MAQASPEIRKGCRLGPIDGANKSRPVTGRTSASGAGGLAVTSGSYSPVE